MLTHGWKLFDHLYATTRSQSGGQSCPVFQSACWPMVVSSVFVHTLAPYVQRSPGIFATAWSSVILGQHHLKRQFHRMHGIIWQMLQLMMTSYSITRSRAPFGLMGLMTYRLASLFQMLFSLGSESAACIYASPYVFGVLFVYRLNSLFQTLLNLGSVSNVFNRIPRLLSYMHADLNSSCSLMMEGASLLCACMDAGRGDCTYRTAGGGQIDGQIYR
jgi:hypothetical protein